MQATTELLRSLGEGSHFAVDCCILAFVAKQHKIWTRLKDRFNTLWFLHCKQTGDPYSPLENGDSK